MKCSPPVSGSVFSSSVSVCSPPRAVSRLPEQVEIENEYYYFFSAPGGTPSRGGIGRSLRRVSTIIPLFITKSSIICLSFHGSGASPVDTEPEVDHTLISLPLSFTRSPGSTGGNRLSKEASDDLFTGISVIAFAVSRALGWRASANEVSGNNTRRSAGIRCLILTV